MIPQRLLGRSERAAADWAKELLSKVELLPRADHRPNAISGGERQRVAVLRALVNEPGIVLADEPTGSLDSGNAHQVMRVFKKLVSDEGKTLLVVTHRTDMDRLADRVFYLQDGNIKEMSDNYIVDI